MQSITELNFLNKDVFLLLIPLGGLECMGRNEHYSIKNINNINNNKHWLHRLSWLFLVLNMLAHKQ